MQIIKEELRNRILEIAEQEFLQNGFDKASLRVIAKKCGTTIGNLYHYFSNKEALFEDLVKQEYNAFLHLMEHNQNSQLIHYDPSHRNDISLKKMFYENIEKLMPVFTKRFLLLIDCSQKTKFETSRKQVLSMIEQHVKMHFMEYSVPVTPGFEITLSEQLLAGLLHIIKTCEDENMKRLLISDMFAFYMAGTLYFS